MKNIWTGNRKKLSFYAVRFCTAIPLMIFAAVAVIAAVGIDRSESAESAYMTSSLRQNIVRAAAMCYAAEGAYPEKLSYLEENYGITVNEEKYTVHYRLVIFHSLTVLSHDLLDLAVAGAGYLVHYLHGLDYHDNVALLYLLGSGISYNDMPNFIYGSFTGLAVTLFNLIPSLTNMLGKSMLPAASAAKAAGDDKRLGECSAGVIFAAAVISVPAGPGISVLAEEILTLLFSGRMVEIAVCADAMRVLGLAVPFVCISSAAFSVLQAADRADIPVKLMGIGAAVKLAGNLILTSVPGLNVTGAAIATLICYIVICVMSLWALASHGGLRLRRTMGICAKIFAAGALCAAGAFITAKQLPAGSHIMIKTAVSCLTGAIIYILSTYFSGVITKSTLKMLIS